MAELEKTAGELFSRALLEIGQRMIQLKLAPAATDIFQRRPQVFSLKITFTSVPPLQVICQGERRLFYRIAEKMKRSLPSGDEEAVEYVMEIFNMVYGTAISAYNRQKNTAIRFGIQDWLKEAPWPREGEYALWERYQSEAGHLRILYQYKKV